MKISYLKLVFTERSDDSWDRFIEEINSCIESTAERRGYEDGDSDRVPIMIGKARLLPLLRAIGHNGKEVLRGAGFDVDGANSTYEEPVVILQEYYGRQESVFVKGHNFLTTKQALGESDREYLL